MRTAVGRWAFFTLLVTLVLGSAWVALFQDALRDALHGYAIAIPFICAWLVWQQRRESANDIPSPNRPLAALLGAGALLAGIGGIVAERAGGIQVASTWLATQMLAWVLAVWAAAFWFLGTRVLRRHAFAVSFLVFTIPFPFLMVEAIEWGLQNSSAWAVEVVFRATHVTYFRDERMFWLPGFQFEVAQECSGIRSTTVLFVTSLLGGYLLLRKPWHRAIVALFIIPLGIARNTVRICVITLLSAHVDPRIIHSPLHHSGGPYFFALSLVPLLLLVWWLRRRELRQASPAPDAPPNPSPVTPGN
ncbi:MAG: archaeosortase/exosortase family protein [Verrucomicrobiae bacterium]|nr:archaeosortase/exosortase family protein [Verrucomicrobiae bacterium]